MYTSSFRASIFYTKTDNRIAEGGPAMAQFSSLDHNFFACISGLLVKETNQEVINRYWSKPVEAWYEKGRDDRSLLMMRFELKSAEMWAVAPSVVEMLKLTSGSTISPAEMGGHQKIAF
ncbi:MAG: pyridoxamine 5'-phosphate oxidase family protein [Paraglaciecola sp.]|uniref:pyridoxamine 5'-phosphate oxidase family protein n=1 Tax=Paraglaciecola sp. TaxID=1920173 RepID=UPI003299A254